MEFKDGKYLVEFEETAQGMVIEDVTDLHGKRKVLVSFPMFGKTLKIVEFKGKKFAQLETEGIKETIQDKYIQGEGESLQEVEDRGDKLYEFLNNEEVTDVIVPFFKAQGLERMKSINIDQIPEDIISKVVYMNNAGPKFEERDLLIYLVMLYRSMATRIHAMSSVAGLN
jgi:hypothetical protein